MKKRKELQSLEEEKANSDMNSHNEEEDKESNNTARLDKYKD